MAIFFTIPLTRGWVETLTRHPVS